MLFSAVLTSADVLFAIMVYAAAAAAQPFLEEWLHRVFKENPPFQWSWDNFIAPLIRAAMIVVFVLLAYPALFGLTVAPGIGELLAEHHLRLNNLVGMMFIATVFLPLLPFFGRHPEVILPLQGILATAVVFNWLADYLNVTSAHPWPGASSAVLMTGLAYMSYYVAIKLGAYFGERLDRKFQTDGLDVVVLHAIQMLVQAPVILVYGYALGRQLAI